MTRLLLALGLILAGGTLSLVAHRQRRLSTGAALTGLVFGAVLGLSAAVDVLRGAAVHSIHLPWSVPFGSFALGLDPLSGFFLVPVLILPAVAGVYGAAYLREWSGRKNLGVSWFLFNTLVACMALVVTARNGVLFLVAWEVMALASYGLVVFEDEREEVRRAGRIYLIATHLGTAGLLVLFLLLSGSSGSLDFDAPGFGLEGGRAAGIAFLLAVIGFGVKAGFVPLHVWLPEAHPASPSHVSAVMSGIMIKTGIYGLLRILVFLGPPAPAWGWILLGLGVVSGLYGILFALAQHDLKRVLAYSSVENVGVIAIGLGLGLLGLSHHLPAMAFFGFAGALLHVLNHALFKGLLFLGAGAVLQAAHVRELDRMGGLLRRMPWTGAFFLIGSASICGLPPLNGLISELLIVLAALEGVSWLNGAGAAAGAVAIAALGLIGGLAAVCFTRAFGIAFLGEPRSASAARAVEAGRSMRLSMALLAVGCVVIGLAGPLVIPELQRVVASIYGGAGEGWMTAPGPSGMQSVPFDPADATRPLRIWMLLSGALLGLVAGLALLRRSLLSRFPVAASPTWDCGYAAPAPRMQYTASSFSQPLTRLFAFALRTRWEIAVPRELFPGVSAGSTATPDPVLGRLYAALYSWFERRLTLRRRLQSGQIQLYVLYIALTLLVLLVWKLS